ncbi:MAG: hypothetical protein AAB221_01185 [Bacteroidota bacterium]
MKKISRIIFIAIVLGSSINAAAQKKLTEATITYDIIINTNDSKPQVADLLDGASSVIYLKGKSSRSEMISPLGTQATIIDGKTGHVTMLKDYGEQRYMIKMTPANWKESNKKYDSIRFTYYNEYKTIEGYKCQKAVGMMADSTTFSVYFCKDLVPINKDFEYLNRNLPGLAMQYEAKLGNKMVTYTVSNISLNPVLQSKFDIPKSGYRLMSYEESKGGGN